MHYLIVLDDDVLASTAEFVGAHIDMQTRRMSAFPESVQTPFDRLIREHSSVGFDVPVCGIMRP
jgi:acyl-CoA thioesterase FadM